jgi:hypothetical protein
MSRTKNKSGKLSKHTKRFEAKMKPQTSSSLHFNNYNPQQILSPCVDVDTVRKISTTSEHFQPPIELYVVINMSTGTSSVCHHCIKYESNNNTETIFEFTSITNTLIKYVCSSSALISPIPPFALVRFKPTHKPLKLQHFVNQLALFTDKEFQFVELRTLLGKRMVICVSEITGKAIIGHLVIQMIQPASNSHKFTEKIAVPFDEIVWIEAHKSCVEAFESIQKKIASSKVIPKLPLISSTSSIQLPP